MRNIFFAAPFLIGSWFGVGQPDDKSEMWLVRNAPDGSFTAQFRACSKGASLDQTQTGRWSLAGDTETLQVLTVNGHALGEVESYKILSHDGGKQVYRYLATGFVYSSRRVDGKFELPSCETIS